MDGRYAGFAAVRRPGAKTGHRGILLHRRSLIAVYLAFGALAAFSRCYQCTVLAVWLMRHSDENAMEPGQVSSRPGYQGCKACHEIQWLEDNVGSAIPNGQSTSWATLSIRCAHGASFRGTVSSADSEHCRPVSTTSAFPILPAGCRRN